MNWKYTPRFSTFSLIGKEGSGDNPDFDKLEQARTYIAAFRGHVIHEVTQIEDSIEELLKSEIGDGSVLSVISEDYIDSISGSFDRKKKLLKKLEEEFSNLESTPNDFDALDWLQQLRNDFAHGKEFMHTSYDYAEIRNKKRVHRLPSEKLEKEFDQKVRRWSELLKR